MMAFILSVSFVARPETVSIVIASNAAPRVQFGAEKLVEVLKSVKVDGGIVRSEPKSGAKIFVSQTNNPAIGREGFVLGRRRGDESQIKIGNRKSEII